MKTAVFDQTSLPCLPVRKSLISLILTLEIDAFRQLGGSSHSWGGAQPLSLGSVALNESLVLSCATVPSLSTTLPSFSIFLNSFASESETIIHSSSERKRISPEPADRPAKLRPSC